MDNELLKSILRQNSRIIIPGFGAFLRKEQGGTLVFTPFLRTDDGKLNAIVALEYGVSAADAQIMIGEFAEKVRTILKVKSKYYIDDVGILMVDSNGVVSFVEDLAKPVEPVMAPQPDFVRPIAQPIVARQQQVAQPIAVQQPAPAPQPISMPQPVPHIPQPVPQPMQQPMQQPMAARNQPLAAPTASPFARPAAPQSVAPPMPPQGQGQGQRPQAPQRSSAPKPKNPGVKPIKKSKKSDMWLVIAILAAAVVIVLMVIGIMNSSQLPPIE